MATQTETIMMGPPLVTHASGEKEMVASHEKSSEVSTPERRLGDGSADIPLESQAEKSPRDLHGIVWGLVVVAILSADFLFALDNTIVADVQPKIVLDLGEIEKLPWIAVAFALGGVAVNLIWGKLFGQFDTKVLFLATVLIFEVGSAICGAARNMNALIVGRAICGVGGSGIYLGAVNILSGLTTRAERPMYLAFAGLTWGAGTVLGPIIGGAFADSSATWRWSFYINLCIGGAVAPIYFLLLPSSNPHPGVSVRSRIRQLDFVGSILIIGAFTSLVMAIAFGGAIYDWNSGQIIGLFVTAAVTWIGFGIQQAFCLFTNEKNRLFPVEFIRSWELDILFAQSAASMTCAFIPIYFIPLFFQFVHNDSALEAGVRLLPYIFLMVGATVANGIIMSKTGVYMPWYLFGGVVIVIGGALMYTATPATSASNIYGYSILIAIGSGGYSQASFSVMQAKVDPKLISQATAFIGCGQLGGITVALAVANTLFINYAQNGISAVLPNAPRATILGAISGAGGPFFGSLNDLQRTQVLQTLVSAIDRTYIMVIVGGAVTILLALVMKREKLDLETIPEDTSLPTN